ncbi:MAG TPA: histidine--tRNA ligase [Kiritimatiellia bacterium]|jgi:histidyl-tRNA synthetase|nr:histidine--tRNA ligase [Kiritimatiellia bacterium]HOM59576.1 histidine--tRNA ligase [Kiritimatiellia bacterium]HOR96818.1 histidine--tRNA ligase [Kiritimatiellia bacterium]HPC49721.1 histidine--tRNA ligase [Kiritimatiellia bacterium]HPW74457.1 histidine--tRNA ligase [Kiritimatiellia bacterium]
MNVPASFSFDPPRGMRDFYPEDMFWRNRIFDAWRQAALAFGFQPYDACVVESLDLLQRKSGEEVSEQIYHFEDKSGRRLALRPEMTPTLARLIAARQGQLVFPVKWFTVAQCFRYERMTRGRKREHYQWNLDVVGEGQVSAEVEVLAAAAEGLRRMGLPEQAYRIHVSNRALLAELLAVSGIAPEHHAAVFLALDKRGKISDDEIAGLLRAEGLKDPAVEQTFALLGIQTLDQAAERVGPDSAAVAALRELFALAGVYGIADRLMFDIAVIRGLAYYTGIVFEAFDSARKFRAIFGGGRYDNLLTTIGGAPTPAVGLGFGDVVIAEVLKDLLSETAATEKNGVIIGYMFPEQRESAMRLARSLREAGERVDLHLARQKPKTFFAKAGAGSAADAIFIGPDDVARGTVRRKHLATREETVIPLPEA